MSGPPALSNVAEPLPRWPARPLTVEEVSEVVAALDLDDCAALRAVPAPVGHVTWLSTLAGDTHTIAVHGGEAGRWIKVEMPGEFTQEQFREDLQMWAESPFYVEVAVL